MRPYYKTTLLVAAAATVAACAETPAPDADFERDLSLAATSIALAPSGATQPLSETLPPAANEEAVRPRRAPEGPRRVASRTPTVRAVVDASPAVSEEGTWSSEAEAPQPVAEVAEDEGGSAGVATPRPVPVSDGLPGDDGMSDGARGRGPSAGEVIGGVIGVVIRGGRVGGVYDDCELHDRRRRDRYPRPRDTRGAGATDRGGPWQVSGGSSRSGNRDGDGRAVWERPGRASGGSSQGGGGGAVWQRVQVRGGSN